MAASKDTIILYQIPIMGHLVPVVELAKLFLAQHFDVVIVLMDSPLNLNPATEFIQRVSTEQPSITFHQLPPLAAVHDETSHPFLNFLRHLSRNNDNLKTFISNQCNTSTIRGIVIDFLSTDAFEVAVELSLPAYFFVTSPAFVLAVYLYLPTLHDIVAASYKEIGEGLLDIPGLPLIPANHLPDNLIERDSDMYKYSICRFSRLRMADGIFINSFEKLEARAVRALRDGLCTPGRPTPPVYCIGPLIAEEQTSGREQKHECIAWLDTQPEDSVVFLCFGSMGTFKAEQIKEIAEGLERSQQRFLWVMRAPPCEGKDLGPLEHFKVEPELGELLPPGFLERTKDRGLVVKKWAPQTAVLAHRAVGGFVTHCGWNSVLESVVNGVAMIVWPLYAEQRLNKVCLVEEMKLAVGMEGYDMELVAATEVEAKVRWLMASEGGEELRGRAKAVKEMAAEARREGGALERAFSEAVGVLRG